LSGSGPWTFSVSGDGTHPVSCQVSDNAGGSGSANDSVKIDTTAPALSASHTADGSGGWNVTSPVTETVTASDATSGLAGAPSCTVGGSPVTLSGSGPWTFQVSSDGTHAVSCSVSDHAGSPSSANDSVKIDTAGPQVTAVHTANGSAGWNVTSPVTETVTASDASGAGFAGVPSCTVGGSPVTLSGSGPWTFSVSGDGTHPVSCQVSDNAGGSDSSNDTVKVDTIPPQTTITSGPKGTVTSRTARFAFKASETGSTFLCKLDRGRFASCASPKSYTKLAGGTHVFQVEAKDHAGNVDHTPAVRKWIVQITRSRSAAAHLVLR